MYEICDPSGPSEREYTVYMLCRFCKMSILQNQHPKCRFCKINILDVDFVKSTV